MPVISWKHRTEDFGDPLTLENKIEIFDAKIFGWQLHPADLCLNGGPDHSETETVKPIPHSGYAGLQILLSYFEMIAKYRDGYIHDDQCRKHFRFGWEWVFPFTNAMERQLIDKFIDYLYANIRCGLHHSLAVGGRIAFSQESNEPILLEKSVPMLIVNPHRFPSMMKKHFKSYIERLKDPKETQLRQNFEKRYDYETS